jgi:hypothetical protein
MTGRSSATRSRTDCVRLRSCHYYCASTTSSLARRGSGRYVHPLAHETGKAFHAAQERGDIPWDEPFDHAMLMTRAESGQGYEFMGLADPALRYLDVFRGRNRARWEARWWREAGGQMKSRSLLLLPTGQYLFADCAIRDFAIEGISALELCEELAIAELGWLAQQYDNGSAVAISAKQGAQLIEEVGPLAADSAIKSVTGWHLHYTWGRGDEEIPPKARVRRLDA